MTEIKPNTLIHGDALDVLRQMQSDSIDFIITDPPYGIDFQSGARAVKLAKIANDKTPFIWWLYDAFRTLVGGGGILCFSRWDVQQVFIDAMKIAGFLVKTVVVWDKGGYGMGDLTGNFSPSYETCIFATKGRYVFPGKRPRDVFQVSRLNSSQITHPNEKPIGIMRQLIEVTTRPNDLILDPFAGSGTTCLAALQSGRRYIGVEISPQHYKAAQKRIDEAEFVVE